MTKAINVLVITVKSLSVAVALMLLLQWPLRVWIGHGSVEANDIGQWIFALYVAFAIGFTTQKNRHFTLGLVGQFKKKQLLIDFLFISLGLIPWSFVILIFAIPKALDSILIQELFPETFNPYYWIIRTSIVIMIINLNLSAIWVFIKNNRILKR